MNLSWQWLAGFIDGEGCFHVGRRASKVVACGYQISAHLVITNTNIPVLKGIAEFTACGAVSKLSETGPNCKPHARYKVYGRGFRFVTANLLPHLIIKRPVALLSWYFSEQRADNGRSGVNSSRGYTDRDTALQRIVSALNTRGTAAPAALLEAEQSTGYTLEHLLQEAEEFYRAHPGGLG